MSFNSFIVSIFIKTKRVTWAAIKDHCSVRRTCGRRRPATKSSSLVPACALGLMLRSLHWIHCAQALVFSILKFHHWYSIQACSASESARLFHTVKCYDFWNIIKFTFFNPKVRKCWACLRNDVFSFIRRRRPLIFFSKQETEFKEDLIHVGCGKKHWKASAVALAVVKWVDMGSF